MHPALNHTEFNDFNRNSNESISICLVARRHPMKGLATFVDVWEKLELEQKRKIKRVIMISHDDLSTFDTTSFDIIVPKSDNDVADVYRLADIFISTSWWEGFGLPPLEAMACGCAVICSKSGGVNEYAIDNYNCIMFEPKDENGLKNCLLEMINNENKSISAITREIIDSATTLPLIATQVS